MHVCCRRGAGPPHRLQPNADGQQAASNSSSPLFPKCRPPIVCFMRELLPCDGLSRHPQRRHMLLPMNATLQNRVLETIGRHSMIRPGRSRRCGRFRRSGFGGFASSACRTCRAKLGIGIFVLHFHHQLRGAEADEDERFVQDSRRNFASNLFSDRADVAGEARRNALESRRCRAAFALSIFRFGRGCARTEPRGRGAYGG